MSITQVDIEPGRRARRRAAELMPGDPLLLLEREWRAKLRQSHENSAEWRRLHKTLPAWAKDGTDQFGRSYGFPELPADPVFTKARMLSRRAGLDDILAYNQNTESLAAAGSKELKRRCAEGRKRVRLWRARKAELKALQKQIGLTRLEARGERLCNELFAIEARIWRTPAASSAGVAVKLRIHLHYETDGTGDASAELYPNECNMLADLERLAGRT